MPWLLSPPAANSAIQVYPAFFSRTELSVKDALKGSAGRSGSYWYFCSEVPKGFWSRLNFC